MASIYKTLGLVFIGILLAGFLIWKWVQKSKDFTPIEPTNIFKSIEYVEELRLTTYFFEELLILGTPENVKQMRDDLQKELEDLRVVEQRRSFIVEQAQNRLKSITDSIFTDNPELANLRQTADQLQDLYKDINISDRRILNRLEENNERYGTEIMEKFKQYQTVEQKIKDTRGNQRKQWESNLNMVAQNLSELIDTERRLRWNSWQKKQADLDLLQTGDKGAQRRLKKDKGEAEKELKKAQKSLEDIQDDITKKKTELERAEKELEEAIATQQDTLKPKLMIIARAQISGYVNLKDLKINQRQFDDTLEVYVPPPMLDSVIVMIDDDSTRLYPLAKPELGKTSEDGAYYDIFKQLKNAIILAEGQVKKRAIEAGILAETRKLTREYITQFAGNLSLPIVFIDSIPQQKTLPPLPVLPDLDSTKVLPKGLLNSLDTLDTSAIKERQENLQDTVKPEIE